MNQRTRIPDDLQPASTRTESSTRIVDRHVASALNSLREAAVMLRATGLPEQAQEVLWLRNRIETEQRYREAHHE